MSIVKAVDRVGTKRKRRHTGTQCPLRYRPFTNFADLRDYDSNLWSGILRHVVHKSFFF